MIEKEQKKIAFKTYGSKIKKKKQKLKHNLRVIKL